MALPTWWEDLLEIQSLDNLIATEQKNSKAQQARALAVTQQKAERQAQHTAQQNQLTQLKAAMLRLENTVEQQTKRLQSLKNNMNQITTTTQLHAAENELASLEPALHQNEDLLLEQLAQQENLEQEIRDSTNFLQGVEQTITELNAEIISAQQKAQAKIAQWQQRIDQLLAALPTNIQHLFQPIYERWRFQQPISFLKDEHCSSCAYTLGREQVAQINRGEIAEVCINCGRLLAPEARNVLVRHQSSPSL